VAEIAAALPDLGDALVVCCGVAGIVGVPSRLALRLSGQLAEATAVPAEAWGTPAQPQIMHV